MQTIRSIRPWRRALVAVAASAALAAACSSSPAVDIESPVATTQPAVVDAMLVVDTPQPGDVFSNLSLISGRSSTEFVGYRLLAGGRPVAQGSLETVRGAFDVKLGFTNECCIEMLLEVFHLNDNGLMVSIPLTYPESG